MPRRNRNRQQEDYAVIAFVAAAVLACTVVAVAEDFRYSVTGVPLWNGWRFQPVSIFAGVVSFVGVLYCLLRIGDPEKALEYIEPYMPLLVLSGASLLVKVNQLWLVPVGAVCLAWSIGRVRKARAQKGFARRLSGS
jgi:hypothetical protein